MALFRRNKQETTDEVPAEVQEYYQAEKRERTWVAWLLALLTLVATVLLALGLYFGGRWAYRQIFNNDRQDPGIGQVQDESDETGGNPAVVEQEQQPTPENENNTPETSTQPQQQGARTESQGVTSSTSTSVPSNTSTSTPTTGPLPSTGPGDVLAVFVIAALAGAGLHRAFGKAN